MSTITVERIQRQAKQARTAKQAKQAPLAGAPRRLSIILAPAPDDLGIIEITARGRTTSYWITADSCELGRWFRLQKEDGQSYDILVAADGRHSCECMGYLAHGRCKHVDGLVAATRAGKL